MPKTALLHFHRASTYAWGNVPDFEQAIKTLEAFENAIIEAIIERTGMTNEEILADFPYLTEEDILATLSYAADRERALVTG